MNTMVLTVLVMAQIAVFQFLAAVFTRSVFAVRLGTPPEPVASETAGYLARVTRWRYALGGVLLVFAAVAGWWLPLERGTTKLLLTVVSLGSTAGLVAAMVRDRRAMRAAYAQLPEAGVRHASLTPRRTGFWYSPYWELVPIATVAVTCAYVYSLTLQLEALPGMLWVWFGLQVAVAFGSLWYAARHGMRVPNVSGRISIFRRKPELALQFGERLAANEARYFMALKIMVVLLLGLKVLRVGMGALESSAVGTVDWLRWILVAAMIVAYAQFIWRLGRLTKRAVRKAEGHAQA